MPDTDDRRAKAGDDQGRDPRSAREARLAKALRDNLRRRKAAEGAPPRDDGLAET